MFNYLIEILGLERIKGVKKVAKNHMVTKKALSLT